jgi:hypothetical protein
MTKLAHHHPFMGKAQDLFGKLIVVAALVGLVVVLASALTSHGNVTW